MLVSGGVLMSDTMDDIEVFSASYEALIEDLYLDVKHKQWTTSQGNCISLENLTDSHLQNIHKWLTLKIPELEDLELKIRKIQLRQIEWEVEARQLLKGGTND